MYPTTFCIPYGYTLASGELVEDEHEQEMIKLMQLWRERDKLSYDKLAVKMNSLNEVTKRDSIWLGATVRKILLREGKK